jgi:hypothetical protein
VVPHPVVADLDDKTLREQLLDVVRRLADAEDPRLCK